jgi:MFS family permease
LYGIAAGMSSPTIYAWTIDRSDERHRGRAMATTYIALETGIGISSVAAGWLYGNEVKNMPYVFWLAAALALAAFVYLQIRYKGLKN